MRYLLISEGPDDQMLFGPIEWLLAQHCRDGFGGEWANPDALQDRSRNLNTRLTQVGQTYQCDMAFIHRDTDTFPFRSRANEIREAIAVSGYISPTVSVIPVRMTEAWFLFDESAIRKAASNVQSRALLNLPNHAESQRRADPKVLLENALVAASGLTGRKLEQFKRDIGRRKRLVSTHIQDYSELRNHESFRNFESELIERLTELGLT